MTLSETIELIAKAMEGVTPGPWHPGHLGTDSTCQCRSIVDEGIYMGAIATVHVDNGLPIGEGGNDAPPAEEAAANMRYIAACSPDRMREVLAAAREAEALKREIAEKDVRIAALEAGISGLVEIARQGVPSIPPDGPTTPEHQAAYEATGFTFVEIRSRARALLSKESDDAAGSATSSKGSGG
jgi:hypothetical protein